MNRKRVLIATPQWGWAPPEASDYRQALAYRLGEWHKEPDCPYTFFFVNIPDVTVQFAREILAQRAVDLNCAFLGMMDDDMMEDPDPGPTIWQKLLAHDVDIVAPLAFMRQHPHYPVIYAVRGGWNETGTWSAENHIVRNYPKNKLVECDAVGFGAVLIKVELFNKIPKPWFKGSCGTGEDILFCTRARHAGFRVFSDTSICLKHLSPRKYIGEEDYERANPGLVELREVVGDWSWDKSKNNLIA